MSQPQREYVIGRDPSCDVVVDDPYVSKRHARVWLDELGGAWIEDLGTMNGTWLNGGPGKGFRVWERAPIAPGVIVHIGHTDIPWTPR